MKDDSNSNSNSQEQNNWWGREETTKKDATNSQPVTTPLTAPEPTAINSAQPTPPKSHRALIISVIVCLAILAGATSAILLNWSKIFPDTTTDSSNDSNSTTNNNTSTSEQVTSTALSSGSATTTIGGKSITYQAAYLVDGIDVTVSSGTFASTTDDEVTFLVINGGSLRIEDGVTVTKSGSSDFSGRGDNYSFYGTNSAIVVVGEGSTAEVSGATISSNVSGANAIVATNSGEVVVRSTTITTEKDNSRGLHATYGGAINADTTTISTKGGSSASLATDRGSGTVTATNMTLNTAGAGSPLVYSTGNITVTNSKGTATGAQIAVVEGKNSITLQGCDFSANGIGNRNSVDNAAIMIYQSMSGDADTGTGSFTATDCTLSVLDTSSQYDSVPFFFITNTDATIDLTGITANFSSNQKFIVAKGTSEWGRSGSNGGKLTITTSDLTATNTTIEVDNVSSVTGL